MSAKHQSSKKLLCLLLHAAKWNCIASRCDNCVPILITVTPSLRLRASHHTHCVSVFVCKTYIGKPIGTLVVPQFTTEVAKPLTLGVKEKCCNSSKKI
jgi:hypothetical protein